MEKVPINLILHTDYEMVDEEPKYGTMFFLKINLEKCQTLNWW